MGEFFCSKNENHVKCKHAFCKGVPRIFAFKTNLWLIIKCRNSSRKDFDLKYAVKWVLQANPIFSPSGSTIKKDLYCTFPVGEFFCSKKENQLKCKNIFCKKAWRILFSKSISGSPQNTGTLLGKILIFNMQWIGIYRPTLFGVLSGSSTKKDFPPRVPGWILLF